MNAKVNLKNNEVGNQFSCFHRNANLKDETEQTYTRANFSNNNAKRKSIN